MLLAGLHEVQADGSGQQSQKAKHHLLATAGNVLLRQHMWWLLAGCWHHVYSSRNLPLKQ
jgi:hypothetical protein